MHKHLTFAFLILHAFAFSQKQGNNWFFGDRDGFDFSSGGPVLVSGGQTTVPNGDVQEGTASISDSAGHLLFYTNGITIWNRYHQVMPHGTGIMGGTSSVQSSLIVPLPGSNNLFYLFTTDDFLHYEIGAGKGMRYSVIDMCADNGRGDVIPALKNVFLLDPTTEKLAAAQDAAGTGYWVLGHEMFSDAIYAYHLTNNGLSGPVISHIDTVNGTGSYWGQAQGQMKISADGSKLATIKGNCTGVALGLFDFDNASGVVSNARRLVLDDDSQGKSGYGCEFSPDGTKVYAGSVAGAGVNHIYQFDVNAGGGSLSGVMASKVAVYTSTPNASSVLFGFQLAPNGKIYLVFDFYYQLASIDNPNLAGTASGFTPLAVQLPNYNGYTLPSFVAGYRYHNGLSFCFNASSAFANCTDSCSGTATSNALNGMPPYNYSWQPGNIPGQSLSNLCPGTYVARVSDAAGNVLFDTVTVEGTVAIPVQLPQDLFVFCANDGATICAPPGFVSYQWNNGYTGQCIFTNLAGNYYVTVTDQNNCTAESNHASAIVYPVPAVSISVNGDTLTAYGANTYQWYLNGTPINNATGPSYVANSDGSYVVLITDENGCSASSLPVIISSINDLQPDEVLVYPNPSHSGEWILKTSNLLTGTILEVCNAQGQVIYTTVIQLPNTLINLQVPTGIYFLNLRLGKETFRKKLVKL